MHNMTEDNTLFGYVGQILRVNLTDSTTEILPSAKYLPEYIGGKALCSKIFWDEVGSGVGAFDPDNKLILATGPTTGTGIPTGGRTTMCGIAPNSLPEQFASGSIGGRLGTVLKYAGYDALIIEGKAPKHTYLLIDDDKISFLDAEAIWGMTVHNSQRSIMLAHGPEICSMVIGPAGENLVRVATITTSNDHNFSKSGFGAVFGAKNLKAVALRGSGAVRPGNIQKVFELRKKIGDPPQIVNRIEPQTEVGKGTNSVRADWDLCRFTCSPGCTARCQKVMMGTKSTFTGELVDQNEKCVSTRAFGSIFDSPFPVWCFIASEKNTITFAQLKSWGKGQVPDDPDMDILKSEAFAGDRLDYFGMSYDRGIVLNQLCNEFGLDKWDVCMWCFAWIGMAKKENLLDDLDFGMEPDPENVDFVKHFITCMTYRYGIGDIFAEGMARAIRTLGKEKYGDVTYHGRYSADGSRQLDLPVSVEAGWGQTYHWTGRGAQGTPKWLWLINSLMFMVNTRDPIASGHIHAKTDSVRRFHEEGPSSSQHLIDMEIRNEWDSLIKDSITACEWQSPAAFWPSQEAEMFGAAIGEEVTADELYAYAERARLLFRAILMRNHGRCRDLEVPQVYPNMTYPDPKGEVATWDEWNDVVDRYYRTSGWDLETGWPYRSTWEKAGLSYIADEMEKLGMLPPEGRTEYIRKPNPIGR